MPEVGYMIAAVVVAGVITLLLRALPFAILKPLRKSRFVKRLGEWMPAGLLLILAVIVLKGEVQAHLQQLWIVATGVAVTILVHLFAGRHALLSIFTGTGVYVTLLYFF